MWCNVMTFEVFRLLSVSWSECGRSLLSADDAEKK